MKYLQKLHDDVSRLKKENTNLKSSIKQYKNKSNNSADGGSIGNITSDNEITPTSSTTLDNLFESSDVDTILSATFSNNTASNHPSQQANTTSNNNDQQTSDHHDEVVAPFVDQQRQLVYSRTGEKFYVGSSSMTLFGIQVQNMLSENGDQDLINAPNAQNLSNTETVLEREGNAYRIMLGKTKTRPGISVNFTLPSYSYAMLLVDSFIQYNDGCFYFFNEGLVKENLRRVYEGLGTDSSDSIIETIWFCKVLLIFSVGEMYLGTANNIDGKKSADAKLPGSGFFHQASELFTGLFASGAIDNCAREGGIEVLLLYAFYLQVADCTVASYFYFGLALRASLILGMHVDADKSNVSRYELEHRRRLWWTVYMYERMLSSKAGLPLSLNDNSIATELPDDFDMFNPPQGCEHYIFPEAEYITNCIKITQINAKILSCLYQKQPNKNILPVLAELVGQLIEFREHLPEFLNPDFTSKDLQISRLATNILTEFFQGMNLAVRPLLFHFASKQLKINKTSNKYIDLNDYSKSIITLFNSSFQASINTIRSLWALMPENMVALFGYLDREYLFTSSATLILFNAAFGVHQATYEHLDHALQIFTKMRNLGNHPSALRRAQLLKLMSTLDFNKIMQPLILKHTDNFQPTQFSNTPVPSSSNSMNHNSNLDGIPSSYNHSNLRKDHSISNSPVQHSTSAIRQGDSGQKRLKIDNMIDSKKLSKNVDNEPVLHDAEGKVSLDAIHMLQHGTVTENENELWKEISNEAMWLGPIGEVSEEFQSLMDDFN
ncbi:Proline utilization trans-activator [Wickerhamomyces ciferrii]|uniref:Proline utilization trans-activator n=1 Tax=Wickerhamomyces ciferrii (strain ATCC 14091 / BCRC 22168 / CBS 111 / JCM 3599 / NBRC 0793 / NRRL Y-1031 F-60-10) TaxID=1206466 RepID=K0KIX3_WICCF|nr:Proline utilization trans-activator [Wickerhamomyces ciferrii]CCH45170.1 Proline utilization trans-activator [Wickerhamomyces ciferrii]